MVQTNPSNPTGQDKLNWQLGWFGTRSWTVQRSVLCPGSRVELFTEINDYVNEACGLHTDTVVD